MKTLIGGLLLVAVAVGPMGCQTDAQTGALLGSMGGAAIGAGIFLIAFSWISLFVRHADPNFISGIGSFITMTAGAIIVASTVSVLKEFHRSKVYDDEPLPDRDTVAAEQAEEALEELV